MSQPSLTPVYERNGRRQSCEPCRKRKVACDHAVPVCSRCQKRGQAMDCRYRAEPRAFGPATPRSLQHESPSQSQSQPRSPKRQRKTDSFSSSALIVELNSSLGFPLDSHRQKTSFAPISDDRISRGAATLTALQDLDLLDKIMSHWLSEGADGYALYWPVYKIWWAEILQSLQGTLRRAPGARSLTALSKLIHENTQAEHCCSGTTKFRDWALQWTGDRLRWEALGLIFVAIGFLCMRSASTAYVFSSKEERINMSKKMMQLVDECLAFCRHCECSNELYLCLLLESTLLLKQVQGEDSHEAWLRMSEVCDSAVILGLHKEKTVDSDTPFYLCELQIRLFNQIQFQDKILSTSLGRPPRISYRHCSVQLNHDIGDEEACLDEPYLTEVLTKLENGWSTSGQLRNASWQRARIHQLKAREDALEIMLGACNVDLESRIERIRSRAASSQEQMPLFARTDPEALLSSIQRSSYHLIPGRDVEWRPRDVMLLVAFHSRMRQTEFLLERAVSCRLQPRDPTTLISSALRLLRLVLKAVSMTLYFREFPSFMSILLAFYALPCAGVLALQLMEHDKTSPYDSSFPRSDIIQQLSVIVHALGAVDHSDSNKNMCYRGMEAIQRALERSLTLSEKSIEPLIDGAIQTDNSYLSENDTSFLQWLGNSDFNASEWYNFMEPV